MHPTICTPAPQQVPSEQNGCQGSTGHCNKAGGHEVDRIVVQNGQPTDGRHVLTDFGRDFARGTVVARELYRSSQQRVHEGAREAGCKPYATV